MPEDQMQFLPGDKCAPRPQIAPVLAIAPDPEPEPEPEVDPGVLDPMGTMKLFGSAPDPTVFSRNLFDEYIIPPFTVLDARQGYWQERRRNWLALNIKSEIGRAEKLTYGKFNQDYDAKTRSEWEQLSPEERIAQGHKFTKARNLSPHVRERYGAGSTSVFDPVLTEMVYRWLCPPEGVVLDPFAGGSVRGIVASCLGRSYYGIELRADQVDANRGQAAEIIRTGVVGPNGVALTRPRWIAGDSDQVLGGSIVPESDLVFTCPPYANLEVYSDDPADISNMRPDEFDEVYTRILGRAVSRLREDRFAAVVISNIRDRDTGRIRDLVGLTNRAMEAAGAVTYNEAVLLNVVGTGALRARKQFNASRKLVRTHQFLICYVKGDPRVASKLIGPIGDPETNAGDFDEAVEVDDLESLG